MKLAPDLRAMLDATETVKHPTTGLPNCSEEEIEQRRFIFEVAYSRKSGHSKFLRANDRTWPTDELKNWAAFTRAVGWSNSRIANHFAEEMAAIKRQEQEQKNAKRN